MNKTDLEHLSTSGCSVCRDIADRESKVKITYRGWAGHFCASRYCNFRLNTLVEMGDVRVVVSTVGNMQVTTGTKTRIEEVGLGRYYETMCFHASQQEGYWDADVTRQVCLNGKWTVATIDINSDGKAQKMHESAVQEIVERILKGEINNG